MTAVQVSPVTGKSAASAPLTATAATESAPVPVLATVKVAAGADEPTVTAPKLPVIGATVATGVVITGVDDVDPEHSADARAATSGVPSPVARS